MYEIITEALLQFEVQYHIKLEDSDKIIQFLIQSFEDYELRYYSPERIYRTFLAFYNNISNNRLQNKVRPYNEVFALCMSGYHLDIKSNQQFDYKPHFYFLDFVPRDIELAGILKELKDNKYSLTPKQEKELLQKYNTNVQRLKEVTEKIKKVTTRYIDINGVVKECEDTIKFYEREYEGYVNDDSRLYIRV